MASNPDTKPSPYKETYINQNTLLGATRKGTTTTTIVTPPVSPISRYLHYSSNLKIY